MRKLQEFLDEQEERTENQDGNAGEGEASKKAAMQKMILLIMEVAT